MKIIGQLVCGPGEAKRYLPETLNEFKRLCDDVVVALCNATPAEKRLVRSYDFRSYEDNREWGKEQPTIKTDLLRRIRQLEPDWIIVLDADETLPTVSRGTFENLSIGRRAMQFYVVNLWNDVSHYNEKLSFWNVRAYQPAAFTSSQFLRRPVHCGNAPPEFYALPARETYVPHLLLHKGLMVPQQRERKVERYNLYDPKAIHKGREYYDALVAREPGDEYTEREVLKKVTQFYDSLQC